MTAGEEGGAAVGSLERAEPQHGFLELALQGDEFNLAIVGGELVKFHAGADFDGEGREPRQPGLNDMEGRGIGFDVVGTAAFGIAAGGVKEGRRGFGEVGRQRQPLQVGKDEVGRQLERRSVGLGKGEAQGVGIQPDDGGDGGQGEGIPADRAGQVENLADPGKAGGTVGAYGVGRGLFQRRAGEIHFGSMRKFGFGFAAQNGGFKGGAGEFARVALGEHLKISEEIFFARFKGYGIGQHFLAGRGQQVAQRGKVHGQDDSTGGQSCSLISTHSLTAPRGALTIPFMELLSGLNPQQQQAVNAGNGPTLVLAGPGSGKTSVLTRRIAYLIGNLGLKPWNILAVTFTNKAAREMGARVEALLGEARGLQLGTFHSICARLLRREAEALPFDSNFVIFDSDDQLSLVKQVLKDLNVDDKTYRPQGVHAAISRAKNELILPDENYPIQNYRDEVVKRVYARYQQALLQNNALDFDDLLLWMTVLAEDHPAVREKYARQFEHILVDEFQDTNTVQYRLLKALASFHRNLFVVGDADQSIYRWRGADYRNVQRFEEDFPDAVTILLEQNYRSTQNILDAAMAVIDRNHFRVRKQLFTERGAGLKLGVQETFNGQEEAAFIVEQIARMVGRGEQQPGDYAIMYRTNAQSRQLEEAFVRANLPYKLVGAQRFYGRREVKDLLCYLRLVFNPHDEASLMRVINVPRRKIGNKTLTDLRTVALNANLSMGAVMLDLGGSEQSEFSGSFGKAAATALEEFGRLLAGWRARYGDSPPLILLDAVLADIDYQSYLDDGTEEGVDRWDNVQELRRLAAEYSERSLGEFLESIALVSDQDTVDENASVPTLLTLHAAKGLEFPVVFITGLEDGTLPHSRSFDEPEEMEEERRLFYVGITRARDRIFLTYALNRSTYGGYSEPTEPSRFLDDIPETLIDGTNPLGLTRYTERHQRQRQDEWERPNRPAAPARVVEPTYRAGLKVRHATFGEGLVLNTKIEDDEEIVDIFFEKAGLKKLAASLARLDVVGGKD